MSMTTTAGPGTRRRRRDERRRETRDLILQAAAQLFARYGYHGVSLDAVAEEAGFTKGAVYSHFSSKQDLLANLLEHYCERQRDQIRSILAEPRPLGERIAQISTWLFGSPQEADDWPLLFAELWLQAMREPGLRPRMQQVHDWSRQSVAAMIDQEAQARGVTLTVPADDLARAVLALGNGLMLQHALTPSEDTAHAYRFALQAMLAAATRSSGEEGSYDRLQP
jgi:AcrR family transcriptional regulator